MKSSLPTGQTGMMQATYGGMIIIARFHVTFEKQL